MKKLAAIFDRTNNALAILAGALSAFIMLGVSIGVIMRYAFHSPIIWIPQFTGYCLLYMTFFALAWLQKRDGHVKVDIVISRLPPRGRAIVNVVNSILCGVVFALLAYYGAKLTVEYFLRGAYNSSSVIQFPTAYLLAVIPPACLLLFIQFMRTAWHSLKSQLPSEKRTERAYEAEA